MFRIGHLGDSNDLTLLGTLAGCEMGLKLAGVRLAGSGVQAAMEHFARHAAPAVPRLLDGSGSLDEGRSPKTFAATLCIPNAITHNSGNTTNEGQHGAKQTRPSDRYCRVGPVGVRHSAGRYVDAVSVSGRWCDLRSGRYRGRQRRHL
jgi:hypothetical protein